MNRKMRKVLTVFLVLLLLPAIALADLEVHFLDVGQGDCAVVLCDGEAVVIDGGPGLPRGWSTGISGRPLAFAISIM